MIFNKLFHSQPEQFLAINIFGKSASLAIFSIEPEISVKEPTFYEFRQNENLTQVIAQFLQKAGLKAGTKAVFGLPSFWIEGEKIKPEFEKSLLDTATELRLEPLAFVSQSAAFGFYKFGQDKKLTSFLVLQVFPQKILAEYFENGEISKSKLEDYSDFVTFDFGKIFEDDVGTIFVFTEDNFDAIKNSLNQFFSQKTLHPQIFEIEKIEFPKSLAQATAFDLGKLPKEQPVAAERSEEFGFVKGQDIGETERQSPLPAFETTAAAPKTTKFPILAALSNFAKFFPKNFPKFGGKKVTFLVFGILAIIGIFALLFWLIPAAEVEVFVKSASFSKDFEIKAQPASSATDSQTLTIPAQVFSLEKEGNKKTVTTGKKKVGEKAQGVVTVFNKTAAVKTFPAGTQILGPQNLRFVLVGAVTVASRSATLEGITFGKNTVKVESVDIGEAYNLSQGSDFTFAEFDSSLYSAHSDSAFTGGSQKEVNVVATDDKKRLEDELIKELREAAKAELTQLAGGAQIQDSTILVKPQNLKFDKEVDAEANLLSLTAKISFTATVFLASDVEKVISEKLKGELPAGFTSWQNTKISTEILKIESDGTAEIKASFTADLIPEIDKVEIARSISGKPVDFAKNYLLSLPDVEAVNFKISPQLPGFLGNLPRSVNKIKIEIKAKSE